MPLLRTSSHYWTEAHLPWLNGENCQLSYWPCSSQKLDKAKDARLASGKGSWIPTNALKAELYSIIQRLKPTPRYGVDDMAAAGKNSVKIAFVFIDMYIIQGMKWSDSLLLTAVTILLSFHGHRLKVTSRLTFVHLISVRLSS